MTWILIIESFLQRLLISTSYSAVNHIQNIMKTHIPSYADNFTFYITAIFFYFACLIYFDSSKGLQIVFSMLSAQALTSSLPIPQEPVSYLTLPGILLYFSSVSTVMWMMNSVSLSNEKLQKATISIVDYVTLFAASRGLAKFQTTGQMNILGIMALAYLINPITPSKSPERYSWISHFFSVVECLSIRGFTLWISIQIKSSFKISNILSIIVIHVFLLVWNPFAITKKLQQCAGILSLIISQQLSILLQLYVDSFACASVLMSVLTWFIYLRICPHFLCDVCKLGTSISMTKWFESQIKNINQPHEAIFVYIFIFFMIEKSLSALNSLSKILDLIYDDNKNVRQSSSSNIIAASIIAQYPSYYSYINGKIDSNNSGTSAIVNESINDGIAHELAVAGLPQPNNVPN